MIDLEAVNSILQATQSLAKAQQNANQVNQTQAAPPASAAPADTDPATSQLFAQLGEVLNNATSSQAASANGANSEVLKRAALLSAQVKALIAKADQLEAELNLSPTPDTVSIDELFAEFNEILELLGQEMKAIKDKVAEKKQAGEMKLEQKPTAMKPGENVGDPSFNTTLSVT
jgi:hypothetical protein